MVNPLVRIVRQQRRKAKYALMDDTKHPEAVLVAEAGRKGEPNSRRIAALIETGKESGLRPVFRHPPARKEVWQKDRDNGVVERLMENGGREGKYWCLGITWENPMPEENQEQVPEILRRTIEKRKGDLRGACQGGEKEQQAVTETLMSEVKRSWLELLMKASAARQARE